MRDFPPSQRVWVGGLTEEVSWKDLQEHMNQAGKTKWVEVYENKGRGTGAVAYGTDEEAANAIATLNGSAVKGAFIQVDVWQKPATPATEMQAGLLKSAAP